MAVGLVEPNELLVVPGIRCTAVAAGIKASGKNDLVLFELAEGSRCAAVFTRNLFCAAPVTIAKQHLSQAAPRYLIINSGNANAGTGKQGMDDAIHTCRIISGHSQCAASEVLPFSTGVIGQNLPLDKFETGIPLALNSLKDDNWLTAARGIMTTDTVAKGVSRQIQIAGKTVTVTGIAKGSGMIRPDMATMLAFIATDVAISQQLIEESLRQAVDVSFNAITVDGDTSTNDACVLMATGQAENTEITTPGADYDAFKKVVSEVCLLLAQAIIRDGEGATKFITISVINAVDTAAARQVAYTIAHSPLVKTALFASDPNWGRILAAVGRAGVPLNLDAIKIYLDDVCIVSNGGRDADYTEEQGQAVMSQDEISIKVDLNSGDAQARVWTNDFSYDYVKINAEYRS